MANYCDYKLKVKGNKEDCFKFKAKLDDYDEPNHFWRIFKSNIDEEGEDYLEISGYCAWSVESCCRASGYSGGLDLFAINTKELNLELEVWSSETEGFFFEEHYIYKNGECLIEDCVDITSYPFWDKTDLPTFAEYLDEFGFDEEEISEDDFDSDGYFIAKSTDWNGFEGWGNWSI